VYLHAQLSHDHGSILKTLSVEVFGSASGNTICLPIPQISRMLEVKNALEQVVIHPRWTEYVQSLFNRQNGNRAHSLASLVRATVLEGNFWHRCQNYVHMVEDVLKAL
jgi:hypothetical protein